MKNWIIVFIIFAIVCIIGYLNKTAFQNCVTNEIQKCEDEGYSNCSVRAKEHCEFIKK